MRLRYSSLPVSASNQRSGLVNIDDYLADVLYVSLFDELKSGSEALLDSKVNTSFKHDWPVSINSIIAVPLHGNSGLMGMMVATNIIDKPDFDSIDVKLFNSVANLCATFIENDRLFGDLKDLFIGSLKTLSNSIDAKDQYTRGHSERVAFISRWIAERLSEHQPIDEDYIHKIYLAGLLHDIGKIGINEAVLLKKGKLSEDDVTVIAGRRDQLAGLLQERYGWKKTDTDNKVEQFAEGLTRQT